VTTSLVPFATKQARLRTNGFSLANSRTPRVNGTSTTFEPAITTQLWGDCFRATLGPSGNLYAYTANNPVSLVDRNGKFPEPPCLCIIPVEPIKCFIGACQDAVE